MWAAVSSQSGKTSNGTMHPPRAAKASPSEMPTAVDWLSLLDEGADEQRCGGGHQSEGGDDGAVAGQEPQSRPKSSAVAPTMKTLDDWLRRTARGPHRRRPERWWPGWPACVGDAELARLDEGRRAIMPIRNMNRTSS